MATIPTIEVNRAGVRVVINECDKQDSDILWSDKPAPKKKAVRKKVAVKK